MRLTYRGRRVGLHSHVELDTCQQVAQGQAHLGPEQVNLNNQTADVFVDLVVVGVPMLLLVVLIKGLDLLREDLAEPREQEGLVTFVGLFRKGGRQFVEEVAGRQDL